MIRRLIILLLIVGCSTDPINILYSGSSGYGVPFLVIAYAWIGMGTILLFNLLLNFNIIKSLPLSEGKQIKLFFVGLIIIYGIALYFNPSQPE